MKKPQRQPDQRCDNCRHFEDLRSVMDEPDEANGYCAQLVNTYGLDRACRMNGGYAGHWTHHESWCEEWEAATPDVGGGN